VTKKTEAGKGPRYVQSVAEPLGQSTTRKAHSTFVKNNKKLVGFVFLLGRARYGTSGGLDFKRKKERSTGKRKTGHGFKLRTGIKGGVGEPIVKETLIPWGVQKKKIQE